jgi:hypothetical protein
VYKTMPKTAHRQAKTVVHVDRKEAEKTRTNVRRRSIETVCASEKYRKAEMHQIVYVRCIRNTRARKVDGRAHSRPPLTHEIDSVRVKARSRGPRHTHRRMSGDEGHIRRSVKLHT